ncbi:unnamed protein product, partial [marine sediment metagenome]
STTYYDELKSKKPKNVNLILRTRDLEYDSFYKYGDDWNKLSMKQFLEKDGNYETFSSYIQAPPDNEYDAILIDGRSRIYCARHIYDHNLLADGGRMLVHDYDRKWYHSIEIWFEPIYSVDRLTLFRKR